MSIHKFVTPPLKKLFSFLSSLKTAIPLLVITIAVTIIGSLFPTPDFFKSWWYLVLLGLNGVSLFFITILHVPMILKRKGRNAMIGVVATHMGILTLIIGVIYGATTGFRYSVKAIEDDMTVVPGLPFVIHLDKLVIEEYSTEAIAKLDPGFIPKKKQDSYLSLFKSGELWLTAVAAPGSPVKADKITILPSFNDIGWYFELIITGPQGNEKVIPIKPWKPPIIKVGETPVMAHSLMDTGELTAQVFTIVDEQMTSLGVVSKAQPLELNGYTIAMGAQKRYTGLSIYNRPQAPILVAGCFLMLFGLVWHFYFRHRDRNLKNKEKEQMDTGSSPA